MKKETEEREREKKNRGVDREAKLERARRVIFVQKKRG